MQVGDLWIRLSLNSSAFEGGLKAVERRTRTFGSVMGDVLKQAFGFAGGIAVFEAFRTGIDRTIKAGIAFNASLEQAKIGFTTMLGSARQADAFLRGLADFAAKTPFEFPELRTAASRVLAFGFSAEQIMPMLQAVGDAAAGLGLSGSEGVNRIIYALGQMRAKAKVSAEEMMQLTEAGIPAWEILAQAMGKSTSEVMKLASDGLIPADKAIQALIDGMERRFPNMMAAQSKSYSGLMSTLRDETGMLFGSVMKPSFSWLTDVVLPRAINLLHKFREGFSAGGLRTALLAIIPPGLIDEFKLLDSALARVKDGISSLADSIRSSRIGEFFAGLKEIVPKVRQAFESGDWEGLGRALADGIVRALTATGDLGVRIAGWVLEQIRSINWGEVGRKSVVGVAGFALGFVNGLLDPAVWWDIVTKHWDDLLALILMIILSPAKWISGITKGLARIPLVGAMLAWLVESVSSLGKQALGYVWDFLVTLGREFVEGLLSGLKSGGVAIAPYFRELLSGAIKAISGFAEDFLLRGMYLAESLGRGLAERLGFLRDTGARLITWAIDGMVWLLEDAVKVGRDFVQGFWRGLVGLGGWLREQVASWVAKHIVQPVKTLLRISSPSDLMDEFGRYAGQGFALGLSKSAPVVREAATSMVGTVIDAVKAGVDAVAFNITRLDKLWELWKAGFRGATDSVQYLTQELDFQNQKLAALREQLSLTEQMYEQSKRLKGEDAEETRRLALEILDLRIKETELANAIAEGNKRLVERQGLSGEMQRLGFKDIKEYANYKAIEMQVRAGKLVTGDAGDFLERLRKAVPDYQAQLRNISRTKNVDLSVAKDMLDSYLLEQYQKGLIKLATGGIVTRPTVALIGERGPEAVVPLQRSGYGGMINITITGNTISNDYDMDRIADRLVKRLRLAGVRV